MYLRNFITNTVVLRVSLLAFPTSTFLETTSEGAGEAIMAYVGCKEGTVLKVLIDSEGGKVMSRTREGVFCGRITAVDRCG